MEGGIVVYILLMLVGLLPVRSESGEWDCCVHSPHAGVCCLSGQGTEGGVVVYILLMLGSAACLVREWRVGLLCTFSSC
jgi:hypothetical protein